MKFVVSSIELLEHLQSVSRVISSKNTLPILDNILFKLSDNTLELTASDLESTFMTSMHLENVTDEGSITIPAKILLDTLKEFPDQPLTFDINTDNYSVVINTESGQFTIMGQNAADFPQIPELKDDESNSLEVGADLLLQGIDSSLFATANDELRPVMNGIFIELSTSDVTFVASDAHKLVRYKRTDASCDVDASFILPKKPSALLKNILPKESGNAIIQFDTKNAFFQLEKYKLICRLVEGNYPSYNSVIPTENPNKVIIDRLQLLNTLKRVSVFSNQASNLIKLQLSGNQITVSAQDIDFSISAFERIACQYEGDEFEIGFKSTFLIEILQNTPSADIVIELSDPSRAGIILPLETENEAEDILMLLMPMSVGS